MHKLLIAIILLSFSGLTHFAAQAARLQILHTNDLHGFFKDTGRDANLGGYGALKVMMNALKDEAQQENIPTLNFNGGDFMEGHISYTAKDGHYTMRAMDYFDFDAVVLGNHDWFMGAGPLNDLVAKWAPGFPLLAANFEVPAMYPGLRRVLKPFTIKIVDGVKIGILGLTTNEPFYRWLVPEVNLRIPLEVANQYIPYLREVEKVDVVILLTHIGVTNDVALAQATTGVDLIVGAHSHTDLQEVLWAENLKKEKVPIVQAGKHGTFLGRLLVDINPHKKLKIEKYELIPVQRSRDDGRFSQFVNEVEKEVEQIYGKQWLNEKIGLATVELVNSRHESTRWGRFVADATREAVDADVGIHVPDFAGQDFAKGQITNRDIFNSYPRVFEFNEHRFGWKVWSADMYGPILKWAIRIAMMAGYSLEISGMSFDMVKKGPVWWPYNFRVNGERLRPWRKYRLAAPEGLITGGYAITSLANVVFANPNRQEISVQQAIKSKLALERVISDDQAESKLNILDGSASRKMVPAVWTK